MSQTGADSPDPAQNALRAGHHQPLFHVVLHEPEIPNNTGNIGRTCVATGCSLHLIHPLGFDTSAKACRRAGLDYWPRLDVREHPSFEHFLIAQSKLVPPPSIPPSPPLWFFTTKASRCIFDAELHMGDYLVFGKETAGLPESILIAHADRTVGLPMLPQERSLNVATAVCAAVYEGIRQLIARGSISVRSDGRFELPSAKSALTGTRLVHNS